MNDELNQQAEPVACIPDGDAEEREFTEKMIAHVYGAQVIGMNECARLSTTLEEKAFWRVLRDYTLEVATKAGAKVTLTHDASILELPGEVGVIRFVARDIELMRATVAKWDAEHPKVSTTPESRL